MLAQGLDDSYMTKMLINKGANIFIKDNTGMEALHYASLMNKYENVKALVEAGAKINCQIKITTSE
jgi:ankyrin repeat protein